MVNQATRKQDFVEHEANIETTIEDISNVVL